MTFKEKVHLHFLTLIEGKITLVNEVLNDLKNSAANETKSTAGDKHETALAMLQIEQANTGAQLEVLLTQWQELLQLNPMLSNSKVNNGSLIKSNNYYFYLSTALGKATIDDEIVFAISPRAPLSTALIGMTVNDTTIFNGVNYTIEQLM